MQEIIEYKIVFIQDYEGIKFSAFDVTFFPFSLPLLYNNFIHFYGMLHSNLVFYMSLYIYYTTKVYRTLGNWRYIHKEVNGFILPYD